MFVKALREMANPNGSSIQSVERHIRKVYSVEVDTGYMLEGKIQTKMIQSQNSVEISGFSCHSEILKSLHTLCSPNPKKMHFFQIHEVFFSDLLRSASRKAVSKNLASHDGSFTYFKSTSAFKKSANIKPKQTTSSSFSSKISSKHSSAPILEEKYEDTSVRPKYLCSLQ